MGAFPNPGDREAAARHLGNAAQDLALLAKQHRLDTVSYLLDMVHLEASQLAVSPQPMREPSAKISQLPAR